MWYSIYAVGDLDLDQEHANIDFMLATVSPDSSSFKNDLIHLIDAITLHFTNEEKIAQERGYDMTEEHVEKHHQLANQLEKMKISLQTDDMIPESIPAVLQEMLKLHILEFDRFLCTSTPS